MDYEGMGEDDLKALRRRYGVVGDAYGSSVGSGEVGVSSVSGSLRDEDARALAHMLSIVSIEHPEFCHERRHCNY